jgi:hypothetical protein
MANRLRSSAQMALCDAKIRVAAPIIFRRRTRSLGLRRRSVRIASQCRVFVAARRACETKALKKSTFVEMHSRDRGSSTNVQATKARTRRPTAPCLCASPCENNCAKVLTLEKTVIRFRPADVTCGRE